jgi:hypothetical protein
MAACTFTNKPNYLVLTFEIHPHSCEIVHLVVVQPISAFRTLDVTHLAEKALNACRIGHNRVYAYSQLNKLAQAGVTRSGVYDGQPYSHGVD